MMKFIRGRSVSNLNSTPKKFNTEKKNSNEEPVINTTCGLTYDSKSNLLTIDTRNGLIKINCNSINNEKLLYQLTNNLNNKKLNFHKEVNSLNSSCNDSIISCCNSTISSCGEASSISELELSSDLTDDGKFCDNQSNASTYQSKTSAEVTRKLLLPREFLENYDCYEKPKLTQHIVKFYTSILCSEVEYKSLSITKETTSKKVIYILLNKFKQKHRDPNLFYLTMEITIKKSGIPVKNIMVLDDESCPAQLKACYPHEEIKFSLMTKYGGLIKVYDSCLMSGSLYKSMLVSENTTVSEIIQLVLHCYNSKDKINNYALYLVGKAGTRKLNSDELVLKIQSEWEDKDQYIFQLRKNKELKMTRAQTNKKYAYNRNLNLVDTSGLSVQEFQNYFYI